MPEFEIVELTPETAGLLDHVAAGVFDNAVRPDQRDAFIASPHHHLCVAVADGLVVGMASGFVYLHPDKAPSMVVLEVGTGDDWLRRGIGKRLMEALLGLAQQIGCAEAWLGTEPDNEAALALYRSLAWGDESMMVLFSFDTGPD